MICRKKLKCDACKHLNGSCVGDKPSKYVFLAQRTETEHILGVTFRGVNSFVTVIY